MSPTGACRGPPSQSRKSSITSSSSSGVLPRNGPTSFFIRTEAEIEQSSSSTDEILSSSTYGIKSLEESVDLEHEQSTSEILDPQLVGDKTIKRKQSSPTSLSIDTILPTESGDIPLRSPTASSDSLAPGRVPSLIDLSQPLTPVFTNSPLHGSAPASTTKSSSLRSFQLYDEDSNADDVASQAVTSSGEEEDDVGASEQLANAPQFVMPSIAMPSRRPFTENGKHMGKLKVVVTGEKGIGKTSLIKSIIQLCEDIVHVDSLSGSLEAIQISHVKPTRYVGQREAPASDPHITEILASTRAYPDWWADVEESRILRRRKSGSETILDRNLCFIESPTMQHKHRIGESSSPVLQLVESLLCRNASLESLTDPEILNMMSENGGVQVDLVIYMLSTDPLILPFDVARMKDLAHLTNVIPVIAKGDLISEEVTQKTKEDVLYRMRQSHIHPFMLGKSILEASVPTDDLSAPFVVSSAVSPEDDSMDASLLMSPDYVHPLVASDLSSLVARIFNPDTASWLRQSSSKKFLNWYRTTYTQAAAKAHLSPLLFPGLLQPSRTLIHRTTLSTSPPTAPLKWATSLQRSLANERARFTALHAADRAVWLTERLGECVRDGTLVAVRPPQPQPPSQLHWTARRSLPPGPAKWTRSGAGAANSLLDPLGLLALNERLARRGRVLVQVLGGAGLVGALAVWVAKWWGWWDGDVTGILGGLGIRFGSTLSGD